LVAAALAVGCTSAQFKSTDGGAGAGGGPGTGGSAGGAGAGGVAGGSGGGGMAGNAVAGSGGAAGRGGTGGVGGAAGTGVAGASGGSGGGAAGGGGSGGAGAAGSGGAAGTTGAAGAGGAPIDGSAPVTPSLAGQIVISELMHNTDVVSDDFGEWFEVYNPDPSVTYDLFGCQIRDLANIHVISKDLLVPPGAYKTLAIFATGGGFTPDYTYSGIKFDNQAADLASIWCGGTLIDSFPYSTAQAPGSGHSFSLDPAHLTAADNDNPADYCLATTVYHTATSGTTTISDYGTPGAANPPCP
jgi:hypothetical protein